MIVGLGTDVLEVPRMAAELRDRAGFREAVFTAAEIAYCEGMRYPALHYAARFAAKEALFKALGADGQAGMRWREAEVLREESGRPHIVLHGSTRELAERLAVDEIFVTLAHIAELASATVVMESRRKSGEGGQRG
ncbi:MAG: holo-ACP synthase [Thermoanaerobaculaceae bacterium]